MWSCEREEAMLYEWSVGCMIGSAFGDSLGAAVEFQSTNEIRKRYGKKGIEVPQPSFDFPYPVITDDTQMAIATARGLVNTPIERRFSDDAILVQIYREYYAWWRTQSDPKESRAPGNTCMMALASQRKGSVSSPLNSSAGCGTIMRIHPIGIAFAGKPHRAFRLGMEAAALTHGHPDGYIPAGAMAMLISYTSFGVPFVTAVSRVMEYLKANFPKGAQGTLKAMNTAMTAPLECDAALKIDTHVGKTGVVGGGWMAHDCFAIALYSIRCSISDPILAVQISVNHSGDSDSTGAVAGAIAGAMHGFQPFLDVLESNEIGLERFTELEQLGCELSDYRL
ncbi:MAG: ADP-ribosylglycohydrolase family protein [bacterium]|nr:ADP-ribosylglycohydrolase family protein [bacterium]